MSSLETRSDAELTERERAINNANFVSYDEDKIEKTNELVLRCH